MCANVCKCMCVAASVCACARILLECHAHVLTFEKKENKRMKIYMYDTSLIFIANAAFAVDMCNINYFLYDTSRPRTVYCIPVHVYRCDHHVNVKRSHTGYSRCARPFGVPRPLFVEITTISPR